MIPRVSDLLTPGTKAAVALSGGADSMALLHMCVDQGLSPIAIHVHHGIRGAEADRDADFAADICAKWGVPLHTFVRDVPAMAKQLGISAEEAGRKARYEVFETFVKNGFTVLTAHNANDNLETMLYHLCRQSGPVGLGGIAPQSGGVARPLLGMTRPQIEDYCRENSIPFVTDSTNLSDDYTRNFIRHNVVPALQQVNPAVVQNAYHAATLLRQDNALLSSLVPMQNIKGDRLDLQGVNALHPSIKARLFAAFLQQNHLPVSRVNIDGLTGLAGGKTAFDGSGATFVRVGQSIVVSGDILPEITPQAVIFGAEYPFLNKKMSFFLQDKQNIQNLDFFITLDYDKIDGCLTIRSRQPGDKITLAGRGVTKTLKKLFNEEEILPAHRAAYPVLCDDRGVVAVVGLGVDQRVAATDTTKSFLTGEIK